jgi:secreted Zn-dependent insulinase-like peptidase
MKELFVDAWLVATRALNLRWLSGIERLVVGPIARCSSSLKWLLRSCVVALLLACTVPDVDARIISSEMDSRSYRALRLANGLRVILVSDPAADKAAAALDLDVGSGSDPEDRAGLAHFLEHMLFLGTDLYPSAGEYQSFIRSHGGNNNAYTTVNHTNYYFDIAASSLQPALDRFARFFVAPLMDPSYIARERAVVHAEYSSKQKDDNRRIWVGRKQALDPLHPQAGFAVGSETTLADRPGDAVEPDLRSFYRQYYHAGRMVLVVLGKESLERLEAMVRQRFAEVPSGSSRAPRNLVPLYRSGSLPLWQVVTPQKETRRLNFIFHVPSPRDYYRTKPLGYLANLLGHEGPGSLLSGLKKKGWASGLSAGAGIVGDDDGTFEISIKLTPTGLDQIPAIGELLFEAIRLVRERGIQSWRYAEQKQLAAMQFQFQETVEPIYLVRSLASRWHDYPVEDLLYAGYRYDALESEQIEDYLQRLVPENLHLLLVAPDQMTDQREFNYGVDFRIESLPDDWLRAWQNPPNTGSLALPEANPFVPSDLSIKPDRAGTTYPVRIAVEPGFDLWFDHDSTFRLPHSSLYLSIRSPRARQTARDSLLTSLYVSLVYDSLNSITYPAFLAGLNFRLYPHRRGLSLKIDGFSERQTYLLRILLERIADPVVDAQRFARLREELVIRLRNRQRGDPTHRAMGALHRLLLERSWSPSILAQLAETIELSEMKLFSEKFLDQTNAVMLSHGNVTLDEARSAAALVSEVILSGRGRREVPHNKVVQLGAHNGLTHSMALEHQDTVAVRYRQGRDQSIQEQARFLMLGQVISSPFYDQLRTRQKLGYVVFSSAMPVRDIPGLVFAVQAPGHSADAVQKSIDQFLENFSGMLEAMDDGVFEQQRQGLLSELLAADQKLTERSDYYWREIDRRAFDFNTRERLARAIRAITKKTLMDALDSMLSDGGDRELRINAYGTAFPRSGNIDREIRSTADFHEAASWFQPAP